MHHPRLLVMLCSYSWSLWHKVVHVLGWRRLNFGPKRRGFDRRYRHFQLQWRCARQPVGGSELFNGGLVP